MQITEENGPSGGRYIDAGWKGAEAEMTFSRASPTLIIIDHTGVPDALRGKGVGQALALHAVGGERHAPAAGRSSRSARSSRPRPNAQPGLAGCDFMKPSSACRLKRQARSTSTG
jgi:hypothetical protein